VNSSTLLQSIVQIILAKNNYSLQNYCRAKIEAYHQKRDTLLKALQDNLPADEDWSKNFEWNVPEGGFFLTIRLPFALDDTLLYQCVQNYGVIFCPMYFFAVEPKQHQYSLRLSFSSLSVSEIEEGVNRLAMFFKNTFIASLKMNK
jgi:(S)-3,5-dihydroxyphenylglycine transaminase